MATLSEQETALAVPNESNSTTNGVLLNGKRPEESSEKIIIWSPSGSSWKDFLYFCGPGWFVSSKSTPNKIVLAEGTDKQTPN